MGIEAEVSTFLKDFKEKMKIWDVLFRDERGKNTQALVDLEGLTAVLFAFPFTWQNIE